MKSPLQVLVDAGAELYEVGGIVRDRLLHRPLGDHDFIVRKLSVDQIVQLLKPFGKVALVGKSFGVIKFSPHASPTTEIDIALPRKEYSTGVGHRDFEVSFDPQLAIEEDLGRRDFTINAMARNVATGEMVDPYRGREDLEQRLIRMVFPQAFEEDPLRLLRAAQFAARFEFEVEADTAAAMKANAHLIKTVSPERIVEEIRKLFLAHRPSEGFRLLHTTSLLQHLFPEVAALIGLQQDKQPGDDVFDHTMRVLDASRSDDALIDPGEIHLMFAALFHDVGKAKTKRYHEPSSRFVFFGHQLVSARQARKWLQAMKVETIGVDPQVVLKLVEHHMFETKAYFTERAIRRFIAKIGKEDIFKLLDLRLADNRGGKHPASIRGVLKLRHRIHDELAKKPPFGAKDLAIDGHDLIKLGLPPGPMLGACIRHLVELVLDDPALNTPDILLKFAEAFWRGHGSTKKEEEKKS